MSKLVVSLTTIPSRVAYLEKTLHSFMQQDCAPDAIELNLPRQYSKRNLGVVHPADVPTGFDIHWIDGDLGPATKVLPTVQRYRGTDTQIVYCDDDHIYDPGWLTRLTETAAAFPAHTITDRWRSTLKWENAARWDRSSPRYRALHALSLGLWKPVRPSGFAPDIAEGMGGVLIRPEFLDDAAYDIPQKFWAVDDVWLSGMLIKNGHPIKPTGINWRAIENTTIVNGTAIGGIDALHDLSQDGIGRMEANINCIRYMRNRYGVFDKGRNRRWRR